MSVSLCIHGHFYQPPREDPWLGIILGEGSAAPMCHWNERILRESYAPLAWARRLDSGGRIADVLNCYEWISFNAGPTLLGWLRGFAPEVLARMAEGDANSARRWGKGNALAQSYHHTILPLTAPEDRALEVRWAVDDFRRHFGRAPEGMWLPECAVDIPSLESLAAEGIRFVILAPRQARAIRVDSRVEPVSEENLHTGEPYAVALPSGRPMTAVFYNGVLSQSIAFNGLLGDGETFWRRIVEESRLLAAQSGGDALLALATDGETYGHHFTFGEMALAHVLAQGYSRRDGLGLTNFAAYIESHPPTRQVLLDEPSSWSCAHGVERWKNDCGCSDGGHPGWNQRWRGPLREALEHMRAGVARHFTETGKTCFSDPAAALAAYGEVLADPARGGEFARKWFTGNGQSHDTAWKLLAMREQSLAAFASCAWFFDDVTRIEPENALTFALRAMELAVETGGPDLTRGVMDILEKASSNRPECGTGRRVFESEVLPRRDTPATLCLLALLLLDSEMRLPPPGYSDEYRFPRVSVEITSEGDARPPLRPSDGTDLSSPSSPASSFLIPAPFSVPVAAPEEYGTAVIRTSLEKEGTRYVWRWVLPSRHKNPGKPFVSLADSAIVVHRLQDNGETGPEYRCRVRDLSRPMRDYLLPRLLDRAEARHTPRLRALAAHTLSLAEPWVEAQREEPCPEMWVEFAPYLALESMRDDVLPDEVRGQMDAMIALHLSPHAASLTAGLVRDAFLEQLAGPQVNEARLVSWVRRARRMLPDMDWWPVQNKVWELGVKHLPALGAELGFRADQL